MTNTKRLNEIIELSGLKRRFIAERMGVSYSTFQRKVKGESSFFSNDIEVLKDLLRLSVNECMEVFFADPMEV